MRKKLLLFMTFIIITTLFVGCGKSEDENTIRNDVKVEDLTAAVADALGENYWPTQKITGEDAAELYGITLDNRDELISEIPMISTNADMLLIAKAKKDKVNVIKKEIEALRDSKVNDTMQYPMNIPKIAASTVKVIGNYVIYVQLGGDAVSNPSDEEIKKACEEDNNTAITAIEDKLKAK